jgi:uncharacterized membrane protein (UPF0127 family)
MNMVIKINDNKFKVKVMMTSSQTQQGMMNKKFDKTFNGMLFLMKDGVHCFWMKDCIIPLDIIFIKDGKIFNIHHNCDPCKSKDCGNYCGEGDMILEVKGGTCKRLNIKLDDTIQF